MPVFPDVHPVASDAANSLTTILGELPVLNTGSSRPSVTLECKLAGPSPGQPMRVLNDGHGHDACGWSFHVNDVFDRDRRLEVILDRPTSGWVEFEHKLLDCLL